MRQIRSIFERANWKRRDEQGQGMVEYGLVLGMVATWVIIFMLALKPLFSEQFAVEAVENATGQGRAQLATELGVNIAILNAPIAADGDDDF